MSGPKLRTCPPSTSTYASSFSTNSNESRAGSRRTTTQYLIIICTVMLINGSSHLVILLTLHRALYCTGSLEKIIVKIYAQATTPLQDSFFPPGIYPLLAKSTGWLQLHDESEVSGPVHCPTTTQYPTLPEPFILLPSTSWNL